MIMLVRSALEVLALPMTNEDTRVNVHAYFCRFKSECYYAMVIGNTAEAEAWLRKYADDVSFVSTQRLKELDFKNMKGNRIIGRSTFIINMQFCCCYGTKARQRSL